MISYTITVCNEEIELDLLLNYLIDNITDDDEIIIQSDSEKVTDGVEEVVENYIDKFKSITYLKFPLNNDFSQFKNNLKKYCSKKWIFNIDADEVPSSFLLENIHEVLNSNPDVDLFLVPRWNTVDGITDEHISKWKWKLDELDRINWPDYQTRIYRNDDKIIWKNKVHERIDGFKTYTMLPEEKEWSLFHAKTIQKQEKQNNFYTTIQ
jgi:glycosyltransferase involved in cell wall biosynthesis